MQRIVQFPLREEGNHVLAVSVSYTETDGPDGQATSGRMRSFRKLYQFLAQPCVSVRTKASELPPREVDDRTLGPYGKVKLIRFALEAQLENVGEGAITLEVRRPGGFNRLANLKSFSKLLAILDLLSKPFRWKSLSARRCFVQGISCK